MPDYDLVIIGSGPAGHTAAFTAVKYGLKTALIERDLDYTGGVCLNEGCIPLKGFLYYSKNEKDFKDIKKNVFKKVQLIKSGLASRLKNGIDLIEGNAEFVSKNEILVNNQNIKSKNFLIATGASPKKIFDQPNVFTSEKIFKLDSLPGRALIIGGGVIGCEYASFLNNMGTDVTIVEVLDSILYGEDEESVRTLMREFKKKKITVHAKTRVADISRDNEVTFVTPQDSVTEKYDMIFETTGRKPNTDIPGLDNAGVTLAGEGFIQIDENMQTSVQGIYAAGDCIDSPMLAYTASKEAETAVDHMANGHSVPPDYSAMPKLVFSSPQVGSIGLSEKDAEATGRKIKIYKYFFKAIGKAVVEGRDAGFIKLITDSDKNEIIGASAVGNEIADIMNELSLIIKNRIKIKDITGCMHIHPSYSEIIVDALNYGGQ